MAAAVALLLLLGVGSSADGTGGAPVVGFPDEGPYFGLDREGNTITLSFDGNQVRDLTVGHRHLGSIPVIHRKWEWHETCQHGYCTKGYWKFHAQLEGSWRPADEEQWRYFTLATSQRFAAGHYVGHDHRHHRVAFTFSHGRIHDFVFGSTSFGSLGVSFRGEFDVCDHEQCLHGMWQSRHHVTGGWRVPDDPAADDQRWQVWWQESAAGVHRTADRG